MVQFLFWGNTNNLGLPIWSAIVDGLKLSNLRLKCIVPLALSQASNILHSIKNGKYRLQNMLSI